jgi:uncharacterized cupredoxin-like copper-binding protein
MLRTRRAIYALVAAIAIATVACSSSSSSSSSSAGSTSSTASSPDTSTSGEIAATVKDFSIAIEPSDVAAGQVKFTISNEGPSTHEFVVVRTDTAPGDLPVDNGLVSEDGIDVIGEAEDIAPSTTPDLVLTLEEGQYVIICNIEGHYEQGMNAGLTVS